MLCCKLVLFQILCRFENNIWHWICHKNELSPLYEKQITCKSKASLDFSFTTSPYFILLEENSYAFLTYWLTVKEYVDSAGKLLGIEMLTNSLCHLLPEILLKNAASTYCGNGGLGYYQYLIMDLSPNTGGKTKGVVPSVANRCPILLRHS